LKSPTKFVGKNKNKKIGQKSLFFFGNFDFQAFSFMQLFYFICCLFFMCGFYFGGGVGGNFCFLDTCSLFWNFKIYEIIVYFI
jgi:hypothetical protein